VRSGGMVRMPRSLCRGDSLKIKEHPQAAQKPGHPYKRSHHPERQRAGALEKGNLEPSVPAEVLTFY
jgi:hypothetical protein